MAKNSSVNLDITNNADGFTVAGGSTQRGITLTGGDVTVTGGGGLTYTFPSVSGTLALLADVSSSTVENLSTTTTLDDTYSGKIIQCTGTFTLTIGNRSAGFNCLIVNISTGTITLAGGSGVTLNTKGSLVGIAQDEAVTVYRQDNNIMRAIGGLS